MIWCFSSSRRRPSSQVGADGGGVGDELLLEQLDRGTGRGACHGIAAKRARVRARRPRHHVGARAGHAKRQARSDPFRDIDDVGRQAEMLEGEHLARASHAGLHLVGDEQNAMLLREIAQPLQKRLRRNDVAPFALDRLDDDRRDFVGRDEMDEDLIADEAE